MARLKSCQRREAVKDFIILTGFSRCQGGMIGRVSRRPKQLHLCRQGFSMTSSSPIKSGLRAGLAAAAVTGCFAVALLAGLPVRAEEANPVLAKVNGAEIRA